MWRSAFESLKIPGSDPHRRCCSSNHRLGRLRIVHTPIADRSPRQIGRHASMEWLRCMPMVPFVVVVGVVSSWPELSWGSTASIPRARSRRTRSARPHTGTGRTSQMPGPTPTTPTRTMRQPGPTSEDHWTSTSASQSSTRTPCQPRLAAPRTWQARLSEPPRVQTKRLRKTRTGSVDHRPGVLENAGYCRRKSRRIRCRGLAEGMNRVGRDLSTRGGRVGKRPWCRLRTGNVCPVTCPGSQSGSQ